MLKNCLLSISLCSNVVFLWQNVVFYGDSFVIGWLLLVGRLSLIPHPSFLIIHPYSLLPTYKRESIRAIILIFSGANAEVFACKLVSNKPLRAINFMLFSAKVLAIASPAGR